MAAVHQVIYIGNKPSKKDNVNNNELRVWTGLGDVQQVSELEARKLAMHTDVWKDITGWPDEAVEKLVNDKREYFRQRERDQQKRNIQAVLRAASLEELREELAMRERMATFKRPEESVLRVRQLEAPVDPAEHIPVSPVRGRPANTTQLGEDVSKAIFAALDSPVGVDDEGQPRLEFVNAKLGYPITEEELATVWRNLQPGEPAIPATTPAPEPKKQAKAK